MSRPPPDDIMHKKGWRQRVRVRGRELMRQQRKRQPKVKPKPLGRKRT